MFRLFTRMRALRASHMWADMSHIQRMNYALAEPMPVILPEIAFYRGMGFKSLGNEHLSEAIHSFKSALDLGFKDRSKVELEIAHCYSLLEGESCNVFGYFRQAVLHAKSIEELSKSVAILSTDGNRLSTQPKPSIAL